MAVVRKKQDDKNLKILREIVSLSGNKQCFDCNQKGPTYVNMTIGSFVCTRCSGLLRGLTPPHRVKSISMATFTFSEIEFIKSHGNEFCAKTWLSLWDPKRVHTQDQRELIIDKYERKRYYLEPASPLKSITNTAQLAPSPKQPTQLNSATLTNGITKSIEENCNNLWSTSTLTAPTKALNVNNINGVVKNSNDVSTLSNVENHLFPTDDFVADFNSAFDAINNKANVSKQTNVQTRNSMQTNGIDVINGNIITSNVNGNVNENFADFEHNTIYNAAGLPMSLSSTSNSLKSSGTFNSNSSINSTPSVDRYAALKDLDEQLREMKEKDTQNTQSIGTPVNPFNIPQLGQANPFQTSSWPNEHSPLKNGFNTSPYNGNAVYAQPNHNGNPHPKIATNTTMANGHLTQPNPFAAPVLNTTTNPFL